MDVELKRGIAAICTRALVGRDALALERFADGLSDMVVRSISSHSGDGERGATRRAMGGGDDGISSRMLSWSSNRAAARGPTCT